MASILLFVLSIIMFFVRNGVKELSFREIIQLSVHKLKNSSIVVSTFSDILLMFSIVAIIIHMDDYSGYNKFFVGIVILLVQKIILLLLLKIINLFRHQ